MIRSIQSWEYIIDRNRAEIFLAIQKGDIEVFGSDQDYLNKIMDEDGDADNDKIAIKVDKSFWVYDNIDWEKGILTPPNSTKIGIHIKTDTLFKRFPRPYIANDQSVSGDVLFGGSYLRTKNTPPLEFHSPRRDRPRITKYNVKPLLNEFKRRKKEELLPSKKEAVYAEAAEWAQNILDEDIPRTTIQRVLASLYE